MIKTRGIDDPNTLLPLHLQFQIQTKAFVGTKHGAAETQKKAPAKLHTDEMRTSVHPKELNLHESLTDQRMQSSCIQQFTLPQFSFAWENCSIRSRSPATASLACNGIGHTDVLSMAELPVCFEP